MGMRDLPGKEANQTGQSLFSGLKIHLDKRCLAPKRRKILEDIVKKNDGEIVSTVPRDDGETIVLTDPARGPASLRANDSIYSVDWISSSIEQGKRLALDKYRLDTKRLPSSVAESSDKRAAGANADLSDTLLAPDYANFTYDCQRKTPLHGPNDELVGRLEKIERHRYLTGNERSALAYRRAISALRAYPRKVARVDEAHAIKAIGDKISMMIGEYLRHGAICEVEKVEADADTNILGELTRVYGIGPKVAAKLVQQGIASIEHLKEAFSAGQVNLTTDQAVGLRYLEDLEQTLDRKSVEEIADIIKGALADESLPKCQAEVVGGHRRGKERSNDVDILISPTEQEDADGILSSIVSKLRASAFITDVLHFNDGAAHPKSALTGRMKTSTIDRLDKCLCIVQPSPASPHCRVDIIVAPRSQWPFALLGWTGSRQFERSIRLWATKEKGMTLSSHALIDDRTGQAFQAESEEEIFKLLGLDYIEPSLRNC